MASTSPPPSTVKEFNDIWRTWINNLWEQLSDIASRVTTLESSSSTVSSVGAVVAFPLTVPTGYLECDGSSISRTTYADLFAYLGVAYGNVDANTFNLPDYQGEFLRGQDNGAGTDPDAAGRTDRGDTTTGDAVGTKQTHEFDEHQHRYNHNANLLYVGGGGNANTKPGNWATSGAIYSTETLGGNETRPTNVYVKYCIRHKD